MENSEASIQEIIKMKRKIKSQRNELRTLNKWVSVYRNLYLQTNEAKNSKAVDNWRAMENMRDQRDELIRMILEFPGDVAKFVHVNYEVPKKRSLLGLWKSKK